MTITADHETTTAGAAWPLPGITRAQAQQLFAALAAVLGQDGREGPADQPAHSVPCLLYTSPSPRDQRGSRMPSSA